MSKGLEALKTIRHIHDMECGKDESINKDFDIIEKELKELEDRREMMRRFNEDCVPMILDNETEKKLKALEIIKEKCSPLLKQYLLLHTRQCVLNF